MKGSEAKGVSGLGVFVAATVVGYAYLGDLSPEQEDVSEPVTLDGK